MQVAAAQPIVVFTDWHMIGSQGLQCGMLNGVGRRITGCGAAGLRVGYGAFPLGLIEYVWRAKQPYNVSVAAETAACAALTNLPYLTEVKDKLVNERANLFAVLDEQPYLEPYKSNANFILCRVVGRDAAELKDELAKQGIMVRYYSKPVSLSGCVRISVGTPEQTLAIKEVLVNL